MPWWSKTPKTNTPKVNNEQNIRATGMRLMGEKKLAEKAFNNAVANNRQAPGTVNIKTTGLALTNATRKYQAHIRAYPHIYR
jgi:hypothetical protein